MARTRTGYVCCAAETICKKAEEQSCPTVSVAEMYERQRERAKRPLAAFIKELGAQNRAKKTGSASNALFEGTAPDGD